MITYKGSFHLMKIFRALAGWGGGRHRSLIDSRANDAFGVPKSTRNGSKQLLRWARRISDVSPILARV